VIFSREPTALRPLLPAAAVGIARNGPRQLLLEESRRITTSRSKASTIFGARDQTCFWAAWPNAKQVPTFAGQARGRGLGAFADLGEGLSPPRPRQPSTQARRDDIFAEILFQAVGGIAHPRSDGALDILLGFGKGFAEIGTLDGEFPLFLSNILVEDNQRNSGKDDSCCKRYQKGKVESLVLPDCIGFALPPKKH
jgi:hypothetical protein